MSNVRLSSIQNFNTENIIFSEAKESNIPGSYRITIASRYPDKSTGPLLFSTDNVYSFGIQENKSLDKPIRTTGFSIPLCLWNKDGPTEYQTQFIETIEKVSEHIKKHMLKNEVKKAVKKYDLVESDLRKFNPLWYKKEDGQIVEGRGPMLYPKLMCDKNLNIYTIFADQYGRDIDALDLIGQKCIVRACVKIESIFIGSKISLQVKVTEVEVQQQGNSRPRLLCKPTPLEEEEEEISIPEQQGRYQDLYENNDQLVQSENEQPDVLEPQEHKERSSPVIQHTPVVETKKPKGGRRLK